MTFKSLLIGFKTLANGWLYRLALLGCYTIAFLYFLIVALMIWKGGTWAYIIYAENPYAHFAGGLVFLLAAHVLRKGDTYRVRDWGLLVAKCTMLCFSLAIAFIIGELGLRYILIKQQEAGSINRLREIKEGARKIPIRTTHPLGVIIEFSDNLDLVYELQPNLDMDFGHKALRTNTRGMRSDREFADEKPPGTLRIIGIGDSGMFGWNVEQGEEYMAVLDRLLNDRGDGISYEVMNMGVPGYNTALEVEALAYNGIPLDPDIVIVGWCRNDYQLPFFMLEKLDFKRRDVSFLMTYLFNRDAMMEMVAGRRVASLRKYDREKLEDETRMNTGAEGVRKSLARLIDLSREHGFKVLVMGPLQSRIKDMLTEMKIPHYNTYDISADDYPEEFLIHYIHPRPGGHEVIAERLAEDLDARGWLTLD